MSQTIRRKQIEYFTTYAGSCLEIWNSIVGQRITHKDDWIGTVVGVKKIDDSIEIEVQLIEGLRRWDTPTKRFRFGKKQRLSGVFTHLTLPREIEKDSETHYWDNEEHLIYELRNLASQASIDQSTSNTFNEIYNQLMRTDRKRELSGQTIQKINNYKQILIDKMVYELRNLASHASIDQSTFNTFDEIYDRLMEMDQKRKLSEQTIQEIDGYQKKLMDRMIYELRDLASHASIDTFYGIYNQLMRLSQKRKLPDQTIQEINGYRKILMDRMQREMARTRLSDLSEKAMNSDIRAYFPLPELDEDDIQLVGKWDSLLSNRDRTSLIDLTETNNKAKWESGRLLSARSAEKIARCFYRNYGEKVKDISITQIDENNNSDWKDYDLDVDGLHVDVKNSRRSQKSKDRYTEHCIPIFKYSRRTNQEVRIAGVFSPYIRTPKLLEPTEHQESDEILFLGETGKKEQQKLKQEFKDLAGFERPNNLSKYFLPPWVFDYPEYVYKERDNALKELKDFPNLALLKEVALEFNLIPVGVAAGIDLTKILDKAALDHWEWCFLKQLRNRREQHGLSLPFIFLTLLSHFLNMASSSKGVSDFNPNKYRKFLFYKGHNNKPLGIYDPLKTIDALIEALRTLWTADNGLIRKFRVFRLMSFNILQGKSNPNENSWTTLIAYCGGRLQDGSACGKNPLVLGKAKRCEHGKLKCPECEFCCDKCRGERSLTSFPSKPLLAANKDG